MLRLWPDRLYAGVFPEGGWMRRRGGRELVRASVEGNADGDPVALLGALLDQRQPARRSRIDVLVSDQLGRTVHMPWQGALISHVQRAAYARACFDRAGLPLDGEWLVHAAYRHMAGDGIAYALPRALVEQVRETLAKRSVGLTSILPLTGAAYWRYGSGLKRRRSVVVLEEHRRVSAMLIDNRQYAGLHVQPSGTIPANAIGRLLNAVDATFPGIQHVQYWSNPGAGAGLDVVKACLPAATIDVLDMMRWRWRWR